jgi:hypothetical protein
MPLPKHHGIRHRRASREHGAGRLNVGASVEKRVEDGDVIATRGPVQRCFGAPVGTWMYDASVDVRPSRNQDGDRM